MAGAGPRPLPLPLLLLVFPIPPSSAALRLLLGAAPPFTCSQPVSATRSGAPAGRQVAERAGQAFGAGGAPGVPAAGRARRQGRGGGCLPLPGCVFPASRQGLAPPAAGRRARRGGWPGARPGRRRWGGGRPGGGSGFPAGRVGGCGGRRGVSLSRERSYRAGPGAGSSEGSGASAPVPPQPRPQFRYRRRPRRAEPRAGERGELPGLAAPAEAPSELSQPVAAGARGPPGERLLSARCCRLTLGGSVKTRHLFLYGVGALCTKFTVRSTEPHECSVKLRCKHGSISVAV